VDGKDMPVFLKHDMEEQIPSLKKQNLKHGEFAKKSIQDLFSTDILKHTLVKEFNYTSSVIAINEGNGEFRVQKLPQMVQFSSLNAIQVMDINADGFPDLVLGGNEFGFLPQFGRLDASFGHILLNNGKGEFTWTNPRISGLQIPGQIRDISKISNINNVYLLFLRNNDTPEMYRMRKTGKK
jgi:hypothetical protein